jgi:hypothetical protein
MNEITHEELNNAQKILDGVINKDSITNMIQCTLIGIVDFMGLENAKKLSPDQLQNMIMVTR